jgi:hypothetical protein
MKHVFHLGLIGLLAIVPACSDSNEGGGNQGDISATGDLGLLALDILGGDTDTMTEADGGGDASPDAVSDIAADVATDLVEDSTPDAPSDTAADVSDTASDAPATDAVTDSEGDTISDTQDTSAGDADALADVAMDMVEDAGPQPDFGQMLTVSEASGAELYAMAVMESGIVVILWRSGENDVLLSPIDPWTSAVSDPIVIEASAGNGSITKGGDVVAMGEHLAVIWWSKNASDDPNDTATQAIRFKTGTLDDLSSPGVILASEANDELWRPHLVAGVPSNLCAFWQQEKDVMMTCSLDQGTTFGAAATVEPNGVSATISTGAFLNTGDLVVAYQAKTGNQNSVYVVQTADLGQTWSAPLDIGITSGVGQALQPTMAPGTAGQIHLAWYNSYQGTTSAWHTLSTDGGTWTAPLELPTIKSWVALKPGRAANLHISGQDAIPGYGTTHYMTSADDGLSWGAATPIPVTPGVETPIEFNAELEANLVEGWLHLAWWEGGVNDQSLRFVTVEP